jgi:hypothetical protein
LIEPDPNVDPGPWWKRLAWLAAIWAMSVAALGLVAALIRWWIV